VSVPFSTARSDFPKLLDQLKTEQVALYVIERDGTPVDVDVAGLNLAQGGQTATGGATRSVEQIVSTRKGNGSAWVPLLGHDPVGNWSLTLPDATAALVRNEQIDDLVLAITYSGAYPS
jgi:hypothetical protein